MGLSAQLDLSIRGVNEFLMTERLEKMPWLISPQRILGHQPEKHSKGQFYQKNKVNDINGIPDMQRPPCKGNRQAGTYETATSDVKIEERSKAS